MTEAHSPRLELFGDVRLARSVAAAGRCVEEMLAGVVGEVDQFMNVAPVADDLTPLLLR